MLAPAQTLRRKLLARRQFVPWGSGTFTPLKLSTPKPTPTPELQAANEKVGQHALGAVPIPWEGGSPHGQVRQPLRACSCGHGACIVW